MLCIAVTVLFSAGQFVLFSYFAPYWKDVLGASPGAISLTFMWFGAFGFIGNMLMSRFIDRLGALRASLIAIGSMALTMLLWPLGTGGLVAAALVLVPWALGCFSSNSAQQARLVSIAPPLAAGSIALNSSAMYAGQAIGAALGGWMILQAGYDSLHWAGLAGLVASMGVSVLAERALRRSPA
jgi:predicted MFS family arabinose efflux permease